MLFCSFTTRKALWLGLALLGTSLMPAVSTSTPTQGPTKPGLCSKAFALTQSTALTHAHPTAAWVSRNRMELFVPRPFILEGRELKFFIGSNESDEVALPLVHHLGRNFHLCTQGLSKSQIKGMVKEALFLKVYEKNGEALRLSYQSPIVATGILDDLFFTEAPLGPHFGPHEISLGLWAPTARKVSLHLWSPNQVTDQVTNQSTVQSNGTKTSHRPPPQFSLQLQASADGVWRAEVPTRFKGYYYLYEVEAFHPSSRKIETHFVTDPYSVSLSANSRYSWLGDLSEYQPAHWDSFAPPQRMGAPLIYESHIRDLTAKDPGLPESLRGRFLGIASESGQSFQHLKSLAGAGFTHLHLLPLNDFATVPELLPEQAFYQPSPEHPLREPSIEIDQIRAQDSYNWGYDPVHFLAPEGSYSTDAQQGGLRVLELRTMIQKLGEAGLGLVMDKVFNHTYAAGGETFSVLDKIVPGYYYRWTQQDGIAQSSCCNDTESERKMFERLMLDALRHWATHYKVAGFRFDLMNLHSTATMSRLRTALLAEFPHLILYGEAWPFGSLFEKKPSSAFTQFNGYGRGIATFNDRMRDALRGGTTSYSEYSDQGLVTGLLDNFNHSPNNKNSPTDPWGQRQKFFHLMDVVKVGLAGNLRDFRFQDHLGNEISGGQLLFRGQPTGVAANPLETVNYISAHDGFTLWDAIQAKLPFRTPFQHPITAHISERFLRHQLGLSFPLMAQGMIFIEGGSELLRSKNGDVDSYDSGDFFNAVDLTGLQNGWGKALPPHWKNGQAWDFWYPRLMAPELRVGQREVLQTLTVVKELAHFRQQSPFFRMSSLTEVQNQVRFFGAAEAPAGVIPMLIQTQDQELLVVWNVTRFNHSWRHEALNQNTAGQAWSAALPKAQGILTRLSVQYSDGENAQVSLPPLSLSIWSRRK